jgi:hypothetical protein
MQVVTLLILMSATCRAESPAGVWKMNSGRSTFAGDAQPKSFTLRIEPHPRGEVFTLERVEQDGRATSESSILYLDGQPRHFEEPGCYGTQSSQRVDSQTVEVLRTCASGGWTRFVRRLTIQRELVHEITAQQPDGRRFERRLVLERQ